MTVTGPDLYELLPAVHRLRDAEAGEPLRALMDVMAEQARVIEEDIAGLYDNWFIETCSEWVVPYIGDLLRVGRLHDFARDGSFSGRARVANTIAYRRRKGTATMLEQLAHDTTGWPARAVEFFELLQTTQHANHPRLHSRRTPDIRDTRNLELVDTAFDTTAHSLDVRHIASGRGKHNIRNVGLYLWRLRSYPIEQASAGDLAGDGRYTFDPLRRDATLFNRPRTETEITHLAEERNVPGRLRRLPLHDELALRRKAIADSVPTTPDALPSEDEQVDLGIKPVFELRVKDANSAVYRLVKPEEIYICNLEEPVPAAPSVWRRPPTTGPAGVRAVAVDPVLGRFAFPDGVLPADVLVSYSEGFSGDIGSGPYNRTAWIADVIDRPVRWQLGVRADAPPNHPEMVPTLGEAVAAWNAVAGRGVVGLITVMDSRSYEQDLTGAGAIDIPDGCLLGVVAADWPESPVRGGVPGQVERRIGDYVPNGLRPHLRGNLTVRGTAAASSETPGTLLLDGLLVEGRLRVNAGHLGRLLVSHTTLVPGQGGLVVAAGNPALSVEVHRSICGSIRVGIDIACVAVESSIVAKVGGHAIDARTTPLDLQRCTVVGKVAGRSLEAGNTLFTEEVDVDRTQIGCVRFSHVPTGSHTPRRYRCQPDLVLDGVPPGGRAAARLRVAPSFTSSVYGDAAFAQQRRTSAAELRTGAEDGSEMGAFGFLRQPQREANLRASLDEYLRFGLEAGLVFVT